MAIWAEMTEDFKTLLRLRTEPVAFRRLEKAKDLDKITNVVRVKRGFTFCQVPFPFLWSPTAKALVSCVGG
jgi:uncharacterized protein (DUF169 family)